MEAHKAARVSRVKLHDGYLIIVTFTANSQSFGAKETDLRDKGLTVIDGGT